MKSPQQTQSSTLESPTTLYPKIEPSITDSKDDIKAATPIQDPTASTSSPKKTDFKKVMLPDGKVLQFKPMNPNATSVFCDFDLTIADAHVHKIIYTKLYGKADLCRTDLKKEGKLSDEEITNKINELFQALKKQHSVDEKFLSEQIEQVAVRGAPGKCKSTIEYLQSKGVVFTISTYSDYPISIKLFLEKKVGINADFLICDIGPKICGKASHPKFTLFQNTEAPKQNLIIIISGTPNKAEAPETTKISTGHYDMGVALLRFLGLRALFPNTLVIDDSNKHLAAAAKKSIATVHADTSDKDGAFWNKTIETAVKLHSTYADRSCSQKDVKCQGSKDKDQDPIDLTGKYIGLMDLHPSLGVAEFPKGLVNIHCNFTRSRKVVSEATKDLPPFSYKIKLEFNDPIEAQKFFRDCNLFLRNFLKFDHEYVYIREGNEDNIIRELSKSLTKHPNESQMRPFMSYIEMRLRERNEYSKACGGINRLFGGFSKSEKISAAFIRLLNLANGLAIPDDKKKALNQKKSRLFQVCKSVEEASGDPKKDVTKDSKKDVKEDPKEDHDKLESTIPRDFTS